jgi:hypothetical protein
MNSSTPAPMMIQSLVVAFDASNWMLLPGAAGGCPGGP